MKTIFVACHTDGNIAGLKTFLTFLNEENYAYYVLLHPLDDYSKVHTTFERPDKKIKTIKRKPKGILNLFGDLWLSVRLIQRTKFDTFVGASNFDTVPAIFCRYILRKKIDKIIYYPRDYSEDRFTSPALNWVYNQVEHWVVTHSNLTISNTTRAKNQRIKMGLKPERSLVLTNPVMLGKPTFDRKLIRKDHFIYVGDVTAEHGLFELVEEISPIIKKLVIIGSGSDWDRTVKLAESKDFELELHQSMPHEFVVEYLRLFNGIGLAPYNHAAKWTYYCSPLKVGEYIASGVPVLMSDVPEVAGLVAAKQLGVVFRSPNIETIKPSVEGLDVADFAKKASEFYDKFNYRKIFREIRL